MLDEDDLGPADEALLDMLRDGRVTAPYASDETGYSLQYTRDRLGRLVEHDNARKVYEGLYELVEDPRGGAGGGPTSVNDSLIEQLVDAHERGDPDAIRDAVDALYEDYGELP
jgi:hypothetical protein